MKTKYSIFSSTLLLCATVLTVGCSSGGGGNGDEGTVGAVIATTSVSGTTGSGSSGGTTASGAFVASDATAATPSSDTTAVLRVDKNGDGILDERDYIYTVPVLSDGSFNFDNIAVDASKPTKAQLSVAKTGFAPVVKTITLTKNTPLSLFADVSSKPVLTEVIKLPAQADRANTFLKFGITSDTNGLSSFSTLISLSELQADANNTTLGEGTLTTATIPTSAFDKNVKSVTVNMQAFDSTKADDIGHFPGAFSGHGKSALGTTTKAADADAEVALESAAFDLLSLTDQDGKAIELQMASQSKLSGEADAATCGALYWERRVTDAQAAVINAWGDDDNNANNGFQVPIWSNDNATGSWQYVGEADWDSTNKQFSICVDTKWQGYLNCDSPINVGGKPKELCIYAVDQNGADVDSLTFKGQKGNSYTSAYLYYGKATLDLPMGTPADWNISYNGAMTNWSNIAVDSTGATSSTTQGCDYDLNVTVDNPYSAQVYVFAYKEDNSTTVPNAYVRLRSTDYGEYYDKGKYTNAKGYALFAVKPNVKYTALYNAGTSAVNVNGSVAAPETADSGKYASVNVSDVNVAPSVYARLNRSRITDATESVPFYISASDNNKDTLQLTALKLNDTPLVKDVDYTVTYQSNYAGVLYVYGILDLNSTTVSGIAPSSLTQGSYTFAASVSDGKKSTTTSATLSVVANSAPIINGLYVLGDNYHYYYKNSSIPAGDYYLNYYVYDRDGDSVTKTMKIDDTDYIPGTLITLAKGDHNVTITADDGQLSSTKEDHLFVGNHAPVINSAGATSYLIDINRGDTFKLFAYVSDKEGDPLTVVATDDNGTKYNLTRVGSYGTKYQTTNITLSEVKAQNNFTIVANDGENNSTQSVVTVESIAANQPPHFTKALTDEEVNVNEAQTFECEATDPEGTFVSYTWSLNDVNLSETGTTLDKTFTATGGNTLSCTATDEDGKSATSKASILVIDPNTSGTLTVHAKYEGLVVAVHDSATYKITTKKLTDANGVAAFSVTGDRTTFSVTAWPGMAIHKKLLMDMTRPHMVYAAQNSCENNDSTECTNADWCALMTANTIPNWVWDSEVDDGGTKPAASDVDANGDGIVTEDELYNAAIFVLDKQNGNNDGKLTYAELNAGDDYQNRNVDEQIFANVPVRDYYVHLNSLSGDGEGVYDEGYYGNGCGEDTSFSSLLTLDYSSVVSTQVTSADTRDVSIDGSGYGYVNNQAINNNEINVSLYTYRVGKNGKFTYLIHEKDHNAGVNEYHYYLLNDKTKAEMDANVTVDVSQFTAADTNVSFVRGDGQSISLNTRYQGIRMDNSVNVDDEDGNSSTFTKQYFTHDGFVYLLETDSYNNSGNSYSTEGYYGDNTLHSSYNIADYPFLDVAFNVNPDDHSWTFSGSDMSKVNVVGFVNNMNSSTTESSGDQNITYDDSLNISVLWTVAPSQVPDVDLQDVVPAEAFADANRTANSDNSSEYMDLTAEEFKGQTETSLLNLIVGSDSTNQSGWSLWENGVRYVSYDSGFEYSTASTETKKPSHKYHNIFSIRLNASNAFTK